jgi:hypothetical protein
MDIKRQKNIITLKLNLPEIKTLTKIIERAAIEYSNQSLKAALMEEQYLSTLHQNNLDDCKAIIKQIEKVI